MKDINCVSCYRKITFKVLLTDFIGGLFKYKYPLCCVLQFVWENHNGLPSSLIRKEKYGLKDKFFWRTHNFKYVPCDRCIETFLRGLKK